jgi:hypothetical protein
VSTTAPAFTLPQFSKTGNAVAFGLNALATWWTWSRGGFGWRLLAVGFAINTLYFAGKLEAQL